MKSFVLVVLLVLGLSRSIFSSKYIEGKVIVLENYDIRFA